jgi:hypothetical protein
VDLNGQLYSLLAEEACLDAGVSLAYYQYPEKVTQIAQGWLVDVRGQGVNYQLRCKQIIDCSGNATVVGMLGFERLREDERQPGTQVVIYKGLDREVVSENAKQIQQMYDQAVKEGGYLEWQSDATHSQYKRECESYLRCRFYRCGYPDTNQPRRQKVGSPDAQVPQDDTWW